MGVSIKCTECEFCNDSRSVGNIRGAFVCKHPDSLYIKDYFREHRLQKMEGFIGFGERFKDKPMIKTSPAWCPKKKKEAVEDGGDR